MMPPSGGAILSVAAGTFVVQVGGNRCAPAIRGCCPVGAIGQGGALTGSLQPGVGAAFAVLYGDASLAVMRVSSGPGRDATGRVVLLGVGSYRGRRAPRRVAPRRLAAQKAAQPATGSAAQRNSPRKSLTKVLDILGGSG